MTQKIKLMSDEERVIFTSEIILNKTYRGFRDMEDLAYKVSTGLLEECEKRATEKLKEVAERFYNMALSNDSTFWISFDEDWKQFLKEQDGKE